MKILGRNLGLFARMDDGVYDTFGMSTNCSINITTDVVEKAADNAFSKSFAAGRYSYTLQSDRLYDGGDMMVRLLQYMVGGIILPFRMAEGDAVGGEMVPKTGTGGIIISGEAFITNYSINAPVEGYANVSISLQGVGRLTVEKDGRELDLGDAASIMTGLIDLEDADSPTTGIIDLGKSV